MSRRIAWAAWVLVVIQVAGFVFLKPGSPRALLSNLTQIAACFTAAGFCLAASRRSRDMARTFWALLAVSLASYGLSNVVWTFYENWRQTAVPFSPISQFLYLCYDAPLVMALFLRESEDPSGLDWQRSLDFVQMLMVAFLIYYDFLFLRALHRGLHSLELMEQAMTNILNFVLAGAFVLRSFWGRTPLVRSLCRRASVYLVVYALAAGVGDYALTFIHATSGAWSSLAWTVPFIVAAILAAGFDPSAETASKVPAESWNQRTFLLKNIGLAVMPLTVWALALRAADHDRIVAYGTVIVSLVCYGAHLTISQYRNHQIVEALRASEERYRLVFKQLLQAEKMQAIGRLAGGVAHDFNNVLTVILGYAQQLLDNRTPSAEIVHRSAGHILTAGERAASLTRQLLAFGRKQLLQPTVLNLNVVLVDIDKMLRRLISENVEIVTKPAPKLGSVRADIGQIEQVILNLAINARDAMPGGGTLTLETGNADLDESYAQEHAGVRPGSYVMLAISDTGIGMDAETQAHIFEPFFTTKEDGKGSGMGLATVYGVVQQSGGHIWVYSEPGRGSTFKLYLPRVEEAAETAAKTQAPAPTIRGTETILVAEDDRQVRDLAVAILKACGYLVLVLESVLEAERVCQQHQGSIDLLLTDVIMREMSGPDLAQRLKKLRPRTKVLFMSGYTDAAIVHQGVLDPGIAFLPKPFTPSSLAGKVRQVLDQPKA
ncbi:putative Periplasmic sensor hybrid histidine kinase [Candidatus Sulfotelmatobacter kueseliae]|uniref:histidine kinase n=1 Tax=Candidatus Sulfotelmatobacter kueseliae TaxID=2042962 RepID=A0A2U3LBS2_9BACT|nr:putative Periplasmic sensor hybrid histidine kinase [Candidatus Sulfotelmatobacter kueseliae]